MSEETVTVKRGDLKDLLMWALEARMKIDVLVATLPCGPASVLQRSIPTNTSPANMRDSWTNWHH